MRMLRDKTHFGPIWGRYRPGFSELVVAEHPKIHFTSMRQYRGEEGDFPSFHPKNPLRSRDLSSPHS